MFSRCSTAGLTLLLSLLLIPRTAPAQEGPTAPEPVLVTSCGQSPGPLKVKVFAQRLGIDFEYNTLAMAEDLVEAKEAGTPSSPSSWSPEPA